MSQLQASGNLLSRNSISFDIHRIIRELLERFTCGRCTLCVADCRIPFKFLSKSVAAAQEKEVKNFAEGLHLPQYNENSLMAHVSGFDDAQLSVPLEPLLIPDLSTMSEEQLKDAAALICQLMDLIQLDRDDANEAGDLYDKDMEKACHFFDISFPSSIHFLRHVCLRHLRFTFSLFLVTYRSLGELILGKIRGRDYLFRDIGKNYKAPIGQELKKKLDMQATNVRSLLMFLKTSCRLWRAVTLKKKSGHCS